VTANPGTAHDPACIVVKGAILDLDSLPDPGFDAQQGDLELVDLRSTRFLSLAEGFFLAALFSGIGIVAWALATRSQEKDLERCF
jgi:hypothetical protein